MIRSFRDKRTRDLFLYGKSKGVPADASVRALRKLDQLNLAACVDDLKVPPGNRFHALKGNRAGQYAICINRQWRLVFEFRAANAYQVEICDYH